MVGSLFLFQLAQERKRKSKDDEISFKESTIF